MSTHKKTPKKFTYHHLSGKAKVKHSALALRVKSEWRKSWFHQALQQWHRIKSAFLPLALLLLAYDAQAITYVSAGVDKVVAGSGVSLSPTSGVGTVTISASGGGAEVGASTAALAGRLDQVAVSTTALAASSGETNTYSSSKTFTAGVLAAGNITTSSSAWVGAGGLSIPQISTLVVSVANRNIAPFILARSTQVGAAQLDAVTHQFAATWSKARSFGTTLSGATDQVIVASGSLSNPQAFTTVPPVGQVFDVKNVRLSTGAASVVMYQEELAVDYGASGGVWGAPTILPTRKLWRVMNQSGNLELKMVLTSTGTLNLGPNVINQSDPSVRLYLQASSATVEGQVNVYGSANFGYGAVQSAPTNGIAVNGEARLDGGVTIGASATRSTFTTTGRYRQAQDAACKTATPNGVGEFCVQNSTTTPIFIATGTAQGAFARLFQSVSMGEAAFTGNTTATTNPGAGTYAKAAGTTTSGMLNEFIMDADNRIRYVGAVPTMCHMGATLSLKSAGTNDVAFSRIYKNGSALTVGTVQQKLGTAGDIASTAIHAMSAVVPGDYFELYVMNNSSGSNLTVTDMNIFALCLGQ